VNIADSPMIDDRNRHSVGVGAGHNLAYLGVNGSAGWYGLRSSSKGNAGCENTQAYDAHEDSLVSTMVITETKEVIMPQIRIEAGWL
jgi:hypothetical protein